MSLLPSSTDLSLSRAPMEYMIDTLGNDIVSLNVAFQRAVDERPLKGIHYSNEHASTGHVSRGGSGGEEFISVTDAFKVLTTLGYTGKVSLSRIKSVYMGLEDVTGVNVGNKERVVSFAHFLRVTYVLFVGRGKQIHADGLDQSLAKTPEVTGAFCEEGSEENVPPGDDNQGGHSAAVDDDTISRSRWAVARKERTDALQNTLNMSRQSLTTHMHVERTELPGDSAEDSTEESPRNPPASDEYRGDEVYSRLLSKDRAPPTDDEATQTFESFNLYGPGGGNKPPPIPWMDAGLVLKELGYVTDAAVDKDATDTTDAPLHPPDSSLEGLGSDEWVMQWRAGEGRRKRDEARFELDVEDEEWETRAARYFDESSLSLETFLRMLGRLKEEVGEKVAGLERAAIDETISEAIKSCVERGVTAATIVRPLLADVLVGTHEKYAESLAGAVDSVIEGAVAAAVDEAMENEKEREATERAKMEAAEMQLELSISVSSGEMSSWDAEADSLSVSSGYMSSLPPSPEAPTATSSIMMTAITTIDADFSSMTNSVITPTCTTTVTTIGGPEAAKHNELEVADEPASSPEEQPPRAKLAPGGNLHDAALEGKLEVLRALIAVGRAVDETDEHGDTPLYNAAGKGLEDVCALLLESGASPNIANNVGETAICVAAAYGQLSCVRLLADAGGDINKALVRAGEEGHSEVVDFLKSKGAFDDEDSLSVSSRAMSSLGPSITCGKDDNIDDQLEESELSVSSRAMSSLAPSVINRPALVDDGGGEDDLSVSSRAMSSLGPSVASQSALHGDSGDSLSVSSQSMSSMAPSINP